ncbi:MAG: DNA recombination protein RmuC [Prevotellaceae bacterium]|jgi:DNA recombination protein RmuC|nr:DNA recombination protein RmuC [Prevotellaceae bacterium]
MIQTAILILLGLLLTAAIVNIWISSSRKSNSDMISDIEKNFSRLDSLVRDEFGRNREENQKLFKNNREELSNSFKLLSDNLTKNVADLSNAQKNQFESYSNRLAELTKSFDEKTKNLQEQLEKSAKENRTEQSDSLKSFEEKFTQNVKDFNDLQKQKFDDMANRQDAVKKETETKLKEIRETVEGKLTNLQDDNNKKLEEMRKTVDEKLQESVEKRFNESFKLINERLESVHKGLGEMQTLAAGVGDLKKVLTNVKTRGTFGEVQLGAILEQVLSPEQYIKNDHPGDDGKVVEYSIKLPGKNNGEPLLLPIDSKFPVEDYQRLTDAYENNASMVEFLGKQFENSVKSCAKDIHDKYIKPPKTTDFAILFVPTEGLYAEILRRPGFCETLQQTFRVVIVGPTNLVAFLSSLQMGFRTLAIEKRSSEVWEILGAVKTEFGKFNKVLLNVKKNLEGGIKNIDDAVGTRTNVMMSKLKKVQELPQEQTVALLGDAVEIEQEFDENSTDDKD